MTVRARPSTHTRLSKTRQVCSSTRRSTKAAERRRRRWLVPTALLLVSCGGDIEVGDPATWTLEDPIAGSAPAQLDSDIETFTAWVARTGCSGGVTGTVFGPQVSRDDSKIEVTFTVEAIPSGLQHCPRNDRVPVEVDLGGPIRDRLVVDGGCPAHSDKPSIGPCDGGPVRWSPPIPPFVCPTTTPPPVDFDISLVPTVPIPAPNDGRDEFEFDVIDTLGPMVVGGEAGQVVATLRRFGWVVTVAELPITTTTITPDLLWNRLVVTLCDGIIHDISYD